MMKSFNLSLIFIGFIVVVSCNVQQNENDKDRIIAAGTMPNLTTDKFGNCMVAFGKGDSIMFISSTDHGKNFSDPILVSVLPGLDAAAMRGPQIAISSERIVILACNKSGDIFSFTKEKSGKWSVPKKVNDVDTVSKEGLMSLAADGNNVFAIWLDLRHGHNEIFGASSVDGANAWSKNKLIYASPDSTVCECCKPSVAIDGKNVFVMFRNLIRGNRDLYLIGSNDGGEHFGEARKLGTGSWQLNGCPMDGGALALNEDGSPGTVWRRNSKIYSCVPGQQEIEIGEGKNCSMESVNGKNIYAWSENGNIIVSHAQQKINLGKGSLPLIKSSDTNEILCVWENEKKIHIASVDL